MSIGLILLVFFFSWHKKKQKSQERTPTSSFSFPTCQRLYCPKTCSSHRSFTPTAQELLAG